MLGEFFFYLSWSWTIATFVAFIFWELDIRRLKKQTRLEIERLENEKTCREIHNA